MSTELRPKVEQESKRSKIKRIYTAINEVAEPGDVVFFITDKPVDRSRPAMERLARLIRRSLQGFSIHDNTTWHTSMFSHSRKERRGAGVRPYVIHSAEEDGTEEIFIPPAYFAIQRNEAGEILSHGRIEIVKNPDLTSDERDSLVAYARGQLGKPWAGLDWKQDVPTYVIGIRAKRLDPDKTSCHGMVFIAYERIGIEFPHQLTTVPFFNPARYIGHPLGGRHCHVNPERLYLHDHHFYRDSRFQSVMAVTQDPNCDEMKLQVSINPGKYSWNPCLRRIYGFDDPRRN